MYYAMIDWTARESKPSSGFANTKAAIAFYTYKARDSFLSTRAYYDYSARAITRKQVIKFGLLEQVKDHRGSFGLHIDSWESADMYVIRASKYSDIEVGQIV